MENLEKQKFRFGTFNLRNTTDHYEKRLPLLINTINEMNFDVAGFQEVSFIEKNQLQDLNKNLNYIHFESQTQLNYAKTNDIIDDKFNIDGNAFLMDKSFHNKLEEEVTHSTLHLSPIRCAHMLQFTLNDVKVNIVNLHLHHVEEEEIIRVYQMKSLLKWIEFKSSQDDLILIVGDFNTLPDSETYKLIIREGFVSSYFNLYGEEPIRTFHNKMDAPYKDASDEGTFDYIL